MTTKQSLLQKWKWPLLSLFLLLGVALFFIFKPNAPESEPLETAPVIRQDIVKLVPSTGRVVPNFEVEIKAKASGKIIHLPYDVSDSVREGELIVQLDPIDESRQVSQAQASLTGLENRTVQSGLNLQVARRSLATDIARAQADLRAAQAKQRDARSKSNRALELSQKRYISQEEYETSATTFAQSGTDLANAQVRLRELQTQQLAIQAQSKDVSVAAAEAQAQRVALASSQQRLSETKIYAPISGVITSRAGQIGQIIASGINNVSGGTAIMTMADLSHIFILAAVDESDIGQVRQGQAVNITADAFPDEIFQGQVIRIAPKGLEETNVVTFEVKIEVLSENKKLLKSEMTANVEILIDRKTNVLSVPVEAITNKNGASYVQVLDGIKNQETQSGKQSGKNKQPVLMRVVTGTNNGVDVEIKSGLREHQQVVLRSGSVQSRWKKDGAEKTSAASENGERPKKNNRRGQMMMMRGMGGGGRR